MAIPTGFFKDGNIQNGGLNLDNAKSAETPSMVVFDSRMIGVWAEDNTTLPTPVNQIRSARAE